ncbi:sensor histidine kinase [Actinomadura litoris]|uniref:histidine kinase n=1 Tax=Actinomadura litoris TaxID=2678616 RepID=A0A7K1KT19_9ACTN|nr:histidine kinase [Actinomadura litoris]MUN35147.1 sensor histidine kinase [Actinomadura litoris]
MRDRWAAAAYLFGALGTAVVTVLGAPLLAVPAQGRAWAERHRRRAGRLLGVAVPARPMTPPMTPPMTRARVGPALRRGLLWPVAHVGTALPSGLALVLCVGNIVTALVAMTAWWAFPADAPPHLQGDVPVDGWTVALTAAPAQAAVLLAVAWWGGPPLARAHARLCLALLAPTPAERLSERLSARVETLTRTRADALDAHAAELRRIERDLHDGVQARLVAVAVRLGVARESLAGAPEDVAVLVGDAHEGVEEAMAELRGVVRGVYPPILADRGLAGALAALAADSAVPTRLSVGRLDAVPAAVETVAYFAVTEALANIARHARATRAQVRVERAGDRLSILVADDGAGGADEARGTGLAGIRRRVAALDGTLRLTSPPGGPTALAVEVPCGS